MTVKELIDVSPSCDIVEIVIRNEGKWVQGYRVGKNAQIYPCEYSVEALEKRKLDKYQRKAIDLDKNEEVDALVGMQLPMKIICKDIRKIPEYIGNLKIRDVLPRHIPMLHRDVLTHNEFQYDIVCYPEGWTPEVPKVEKQEENLDGQMSIEEMIGEEWYGGLGDE